MNKTTQKKEEIEKFITDTKEIRAETGFSISKLLELKKKGYKIVKFEEVQICH